MTISPLSTLNTLIALLFVLQTLINGSLGHGSSVKDEVSNPVVRTPLGSIRGTTIKSRKGAAILSFLGVRYAEAPVGELRFQPPVPVKSWKGTYDATENSALCPQPSLNRTSEDCLFLNVFTLHLPNKDKLRKRPVMVFFHPGGFFEGTSSSRGFGPHYLMDEDIVLVMPNYRLQTLGFLATGTKEAPGNNGFKDQVQVLRWIQQNIASFNGDSNDVTISGYSSGGISVTLHLVSPMSKGLFHKAISMSGSSFGNRPVDTNQMRLAKRQAELVNCPVEPPKALVECLKTKTAEELSNNLAGFREFLNYLAGLWSAVVEPDFGQERFLVEHPVTSLLNKRVADVPVMIGCTTDEFGGRSYAIVNNQTALEEFDKDYKRIWPIVFVYERDTEFSFRVSEGLRKFYFPDNQIDASKRQEIAHLFADGIVGFGANRGAKLLFENLVNNVYYYRFDYKRRYSYFYKPGTNNTVPDGVAHHDDLLYLFYVARLTPFFTDGPDGAIVDTMTQLWGHFVKHGNPNSKNRKWPPFDLNRQQFLDISTNLTTQAFLYKDRYDTWENLYPVSMYLD